ncbi:MAG: alpha/beta hydrolase [Bacteroidota bacterium]|nr:alpha/beta hydrolase [Bacteroidota bacterium]
MPYLQTAKSSIANPVNLYYEDTLHGEPVIFIHGWPLNSCMWEYQLNELPRYGLRCIAYDRRGFGKSDKPWGNYDYDTLAGDLKGVIDELNLEKVTLVGFSMGGGEVARYIGKYGTEKIHQVVLISSVTPFMLKTDDNPDGISQETFDDFIGQLREDRPGFLAHFGKLFYGVSLLNKAVGQDFLNWNQSLVLQASPKATIDCIRSFSETDFRPDLPKINVPALIIHGNSDKIVPMEMSGQKAAQLIPQAKFKIYDNEPHGLFYTQKERLNQDLLDFIVGSDTEEDPLYNDEENSSLNDPSWLDPTIYPNNSFPII